MSSMAKTTEDHAHKLRITGIGEEFDYEIVHLDSCPTEDHILEPWGGEGTYCTYTEHTCPVGAWVEFWGMDDVDPDIHTLLPGDYQLHWIYYNAESMYEDNDVEFWVEVPE